MCLTAQPAGGTGGLLWATPPIGFIAGAPFVAAWFTLILGLLRSAAAGIVTAECEETLRTCENATRDGFIVFGVGTGSTPFASLVLWGLRASSTLISNRGSG